MNHNYPIRGMTVTCIVAVVIAACSESSRERPLPTNPNPPLPSTPVLTQITINGPTTVHIGETSQYTATGQYSDGSTRDVTTEATWTGSTSMLDVLGSGRYTGRASGLAGLGARLLNRSAFIGSIIVVPPGTYRLAGTVRDSGLAVNAPVLIEDSLGYRTVPTANGLYSVFGVAGDTRITVAKDGYHPQTKHLAISSHQVLDFALEPSRPRSDLSGRYQLTIAAAAECTTLPADVRSRSFIAVVEQQGPTLTVRLDSGQFFTQGGRTFDRFTGFVEPNQVVFNLSPSVADPYYYYYYLPDVIEILGTNAVYGFQGRVITPLGERLSNTFNGFIARYTSTPFRTTAQCLSDLHEFLMVKER